MSICRQVSENGNKFEMESLRACILGYERKFATLNLHKHWASCKIEFVLSAWLPTAPAQRSHSFGVFDGIDPRSVSTSKSSASLNYPMYECN